VSVSYRVCVNRRRSCALFGVTQPKVDAGVSSKSDILPLEVSSQPLVVNEHGGGVNDLWIGSDVTCKERWRTTLPPAVT